jgi:hypothetical protein
MLVGQPPEHTRATSPTTGNAIRITTHTAGTPYVDAGAAAHDFVDKNVTASIGASGLKAVMAAALSGVPTPPDAPLLIQYNVRDYAGNAADTAVRRVYLVCAATATLCERRDSPGSWYCDTLGSCVSAPDIASPSYASSFAPAQLSLVGPALVYVEQGAPYVRCPLQAPTDAVCDCGATAVDAIEGDMTAQVDAC